MADLANEEDEPLDDDSGIEFCKYAQISSSHACDSIHSVLIDLRFGIV